MSTLGLPVNPAAAVRAGFADGTSLKGVMDMLRANAVLQLELIAGARGKGGRAASPCAGLLGRTFFDGSSDVRVVGLCPSNPSHVVLERRADGRRWTAPSGLLRLILGRGLRRHPATRLTPIIMVTACASEADAATGLDVGADDYVRKPFSVRELVARVRALLRRAGEDAQTYEDEQLSIDYAGMKVACEGRDVRLTRKEFALLVALAECAGRVATRKHLLERVWGHQYYGGERTLDVHVRRLRQNLGRCGERIETVTGVGYRFARSGATGDPRLEGETTESVSASGNGFPANRHFI